MLDLKSFVFIVLSLCLCIQIGIIVMHCISGFKRRKRPMKPACADPYNWQMRNNIDAINLDLLAQKRELPQQKAMKRIRADAEVYFNNHKLPWYLRPFKKQVKHIVVDSFVAGHLDAKKKFGISETVKIPRPTPFVNTDFPISSWEET